MPPILIVQKDATAVHHVHDIPAVLLLAQIYSTLLKITWQ
jgi:hypothetical protein